MMSNLPFSMKDRVHVHVHVHVVYLCTRIILCEN